MFSFLAHIKHRNFLRLWLAQIISQFGDRIHQFALVALIAEKTGGSSSSTMDLAKLMSFTILPAFVFQPIAGVFVDRFDRRTTLFICDIVRGLLVLTIPFIFIHWDSMVPIYVVVFLVFCFPRFYVPAKMSLIPDLVQSEENLLKANSLITTTGMIAAVLGVAFGAVIMEWYGARNGFIIDAATFFISATFLFGMSLPWRLRLKTRQMIEKGKALAQRVREKSIMTEIKEGFHYIFSHQDIRLVINTMFALFAIVGAVYVVIVVFIQESFQSVTKDLGVLVFCLAAGLFLGAMIYGRIGKKFSWHKTIFFCLMLGGVFMTAFALGVHYSQSLIYAMILAGLLGAAIGPIFVASNTVLHIVSDPQMQGKVFSALEIIIHAAFLITMLISSWASQYIPKVWILVFAGVACVLVGVLGLLRGKLAIEK